MSKIDKLDEGVEVRKGKKYLVWWSDLDPSNIQLPTPRELMTKLWEVLGGKKNEDQYKG